MVTDLSLEFETLPLVLVLQICLFGLDAFEPLYAPFDLDWQALDVSGALSEQSGQSAMDEAEHSVLERRV